MATRSYVGIEREDGTIDAVYIHWDGYPERRGRAFEQGGYVTREKVEELIRRGGASSIILESYSNIYDEPAVTFQSRQDYADAFRNSSIEYLYLFCRGEEKWRYMVADCCDPTDALQSFKSWELLMSTRDEEKLERKDGERFEYKDRAGQTHELVVVENDGDVGCYGCFFCWTKGDTLDERCVRDDEDKKQTGECARDDYCVYFALASDVARGEAREAFDSGHKDYEIAEKMIQATLDTITSSDVLVGEIEKILSAARGEIDEGGDYDDGFYDDEDSDYDDTDDGDEDEQ